MKYTLNLLIIAVSAFIVASCMDDNTNSDKKPNVGVKQDTPEYKAYNVVQNLKAVRQLETNAKQKGQSIALKVNSTYANGKDGFFWFQVVLNMGKTELPKMNIKVREITYDVTIRDDKTGDNLTEEEYLKKYPIQ